MATTTSTARIVHKDRYNEQHFFDIPHSALPPLKDSWVRLQLRLITIGSVNLSYCALGSIVHWWDAYPLPPTLPAPFNDASQYGIAPGWGFSEVVESKNPELPVGTAMYDHSPTSAFPVDMSFTKSTHVPNQWIEVSEGRKRLMDAYSRFDVIPDGWQNVKKSAQHLGLRILFDAGYVFNRFPFASWPTDSVIHPFPELKAPWSAEDADLTNAVVIALASGTRTSRAFVQQLGNNRSPGSGPKGLVEITSNTFTVLAGSKLPFKHRVLRYGDAVSPDLIQWIADIGPKRIVVTDFGGRDNILETLTVYLETQIPSAKVDVIGVGREAEFNPEKRAAATQLSGTRMNTSGIRVAAMKQIGEAQYFQQSDDAYHQMIKSEQARLESLPPGDRHILGVKVSIKDGMQGSEGLEQAWNDLCVGGKLHGSEALVYRV